MASPLLEKDLNTFSALGGDRSLKTQVLNLPLRFCCQALAGTGLTQLLLAIPTRRSLLFALEHQLNVHAGCQKVQPKP